MDCLREETVSVSGRSGAQSSVAGIEDLVLTVMRLFQCGLRIHLFFTHFLSEILVGMDK